MKTVIYNAIRTLAAGALTVVCAAALLSTGCASTGSAAEKSTSMTTVAEAQEISSSPAESVSQDTVTVTSRSSVYAVPDLAELNFGIRTQAKTATEAQKDNSKSVDAVVDVLKQNGIKEENIRTAMYDVSAQYDWETGDGTNIIGYNVYSSLKVKDVAVGEAGSLITACIKAGAKEFNGISYHCTNYDELYAEAMKEAVAAAKTKAEALAGAAGRNLGGVRTISEGYQDMTYASSSAKAYAASGMGSAEDAEVSAALMPGQAEITAAVTVTYILQ